MEKQSIPEGYCGLCDKCGKPGHTRHFPGMVPFTGTWCEKHFRMAMWLHPLGGKGIYLYIGFFLLAVVGLLFL
jgi:hypothetical protein